MPVNNIPVTLYGPATLAASGDTTLFTALTDYVYMLDMVKVVNNTSAKVTVKFGNMGSADTNLICPPVGVPKQGMVTLDKQVAGHLITGAGVEVGSEQYLVCNTSATGVTVTVEGTIRYPGF
jgi:hypothetical protein